MGVAVFAGMLGVTVFGLFLTPVFYMVVGRLAGACRTPRAGAGGAVGACRRGGSLMMSNTHARTAIVGCRVAGALLLTACLQPARRRTQAPADSRRHSRGRRRDVLR